MRASTLKKDNLIRILKTKEKKSKVEVETTTTKEVINTYIKRKKEKR